jgi:pimeloyl-ACP methyl ester carboxylesterase
VLLPADLSGRPAPTQPPSPARSGGPLPEELLAQTRVPVSILWGEADPWEDHVEGRRLFGGYPCVEEFVTLPGVGHCPQDEAPQLVNPLIRAFVERHAGGGGRAGGVLDAVSAG